ncbi:hypothetical protein [Bacillus piscicola]|uniref:hypothetical protein n=1 Tax=Bacillus piscicola TaxID=1632684 RepID=UPI001F08B4F0|nr:hypothetical protein [Bacillus piscicola]
MDKKEPSYSSPYLSEEASNKRNIAKGEEKEQATPEKSHDRWSELLFGRRSFPSPPPEENSSKD